MGKRKGDNVFFAWLFFHAGEIEGAAPYPRGGSCFQAAKGKTEAAQICPQAKSGGFPKTARSRGEIADKDFAFHESSCGKHDFPGREDSAALGNNAVCRPAGTAGVYIRYRVLKEGKAARSFKRAPGKGGVQGFIRLGAGRLYRRAAASV
jgi:hypothetical protein